MPPPVPRSRLYPGCYVDNQRYKLLRILGEGGNGTVWLAEHLKMGTQVAIKFPNNRIQKSDLFNGEMRNHIHFSNRHPSIVSILDAGDIQGLPYMVMQFLSNGTLDNRIRKQTRSELSKGTTPWLPTIADALDFLHANNLVHADVKPANILFDDSLSAYLGDLGIASALDVGQHKSSQKDVLLGSIPYLAPEVLNSGQRSAASDQYALGLSLFEYITGTSPYAGKFAAEVLLSQQAGPPSFLATNYVVPTEIQQIVLRSLQFKPSLRFSCCTEFALAIRPYWQTIQAIVSSSERSSPATVVSSRPSESVTTSNNTSTGAVTKPPPQKMPRGIPTAKEQDARTIRSSRLFRNTENKYLNEDIDPKRQS